MTPASLYRSRPVFCCGAVEFGPADIMDGAWLRGESGAPWSRFLDSLMAARRAAELGLEPEPSALQEMSEEFRYERDLVSAEVTDHWLTSRAVTEEDFGAYFLRRYWLEHADNAFGSVGHDASYPSYPFAEEALRRLFLIDVMISGVFDQFARGLSWRAVALADALASGVLPEGALGKVVLLERVCMCEEEASDALCRLGRGADWLQTAAQMESAFAAACAQAVTDEDRARALAFRRMGLTRISLETIYAPTLDAARELVFRLSERAGPASGLAAECGFDSGWDMVFVEDCSPEFQQTLLCARPGEVLPVQAFRGKFKVCRLAGKEDPDLRDAAIGDRIDRLIIQSHFSERIAGRVKWLNGTK